MDAHYQYRRWDGSQEYSDLDPDALLAELTDELLAHGDLEEAIERILRQGFDTPEGDHVDGLRDLLDQLRDRKAELEDLGDPSGEYARYGEQLRSIEALEREGIDELEAEAQASGDARRQEVTEEVVAERRMALDLLPGDLPSRLQAMQHYDFVSSAAREAFDELLDELRREVTETYLQGVTEAMEQMDDAALAHLRDAMAALNQMLEQRANGEPIDPSFEQFMDQYGDLFPGAENLDQLLEQLAERMAAAEAMWNSMSPEQRARLQGLMGSVLSDLGLAMEMDRLNANLRSAFPEAGWSRRFQLSGPGNLSMGEATDVASQLNQLERLEEMLQGAVHPAALSEIDLDQVRRNLGEDAARNLERLAGYTKALEDAGLIANQGGRLELTAQGVRRMGRQALNDLFNALKAKDAGGHQATFAGSGHDREETTKAYEFGDPLNLHLSKTVHNAVARSGGGTPVSLSPEDFEVIETEALARSATVLCLDLSMSMPMRDNFVPAKKLALALQTLISTRFPRDYLGIVGFSEVAHEIKADQVPTAMWDYVYGTNLQHALLLARKMLAREHGTKQIIVVTDGEPTAHLDPASGIPLFSYPPVPETLRLTMAEVVRCTRAKITINTFALDLERTQYPFVEQIARVNGGRTFYTTKDAIGGYVLVDFLRQRRHMRPAG